jgi:hypothetical protein
MIFWKPLRRLVICSGEKVLDVPQVFLFPGWRGGGNAYRPGASILTCIAVTGGILMKPRRFLGLCTETEKRVPGSSYMKESMEMTK